MTDREAIRKRWEEAGQDQVFRFVDNAEKWKLDDEAVETFWKQLSLFAPEHLTHLHKTLLSADREASESDEITPLPESAFVRPSTQTADERAELRSTGLQHIAKGRVAALLLAGGMGTRLGSSEPKGMYDCKFPSGKTLFQIQAERLQRIAVLAAKESGVEPSTVHIPWLIMTSAQTNEATVDFLTKNNFFGVPENDVLFFQQAQQPCIGNDGKILLETPTVVAASPNGNGGIYSALATSGVMDELRKRKIECVFTYGVDNVLVRLCDPLMIGAMVKNNADLVNKVVMREQPEEKVGCVCLRNGKPSVVEYGEIDPADASRRDESTGHLVFNGANVAMHLFSMGFIQRVLDDRDKLLVNHIARKKIPYCDENGETQRPSENNGVKFELFIFDPFVTAENALAFEAQRDEEFSPLKNASGSDSPDTCREMLSALHARYIAHAGGKVDAGSGLVEVSPLVSYAGEGLETLQGRTFERPVHISSV